MKSTLVCIHVMPLEIEMFERFIIRYKHALQYLDETDDVTIKATLNLNPLLTDWDSSKLKQQYFIDKFNSHFHDVKNINEIILDDSVWGTTQQKRDSYKLDYDQFIFVDNDIAIHPLLLKTQLIGSYQIDGMYIISPSIPRWWDQSWDVLVHRDYKNSEIGIATHKETFDKVFTQEVKDIQMRQLSTIKFGCGMHTLYSKSFWEFVQIPDSFKGYGPEDTFAMYASQIAIQKRYPIKQFVLDGVFITEDYHSREPLIKEMISPINMKETFYESAKSKMKDELELFLKRI